MSQQRDVYGDGQGDLSGVLDEYGPAWNLEGELPASMLSTDSILATQALSMRILRNGARTAIHNKRRHGFSLLNNLKSLDDVAYDSSTEEYMTCRVAKIDFGQWTMKVIFRVNELSEEQKNISHIETYSFDWLRDGSNQAWHSEHVTKAIDGATFRYWHSIWPLGEQHIKLLHQRMNSHAQSAAAAIMLSGLHLKESPLDDILK